MDHILPELRGLTLDTHGAQLFPPLSPGAQRCLGNAIGDLAPDQAGIRLFNNAAVRPMLGVSGPVGTLAAALLGEKCRPVRAILFDKTATTNWSLGWHQDRTISVARRVDTDGFGPWTLKGGIVHVEPPFQLLENMLTVRVHIDPVPATNAPLLIAPGSHRLGRIAAARIPEIVRRCGKVACLADAGDIWLYATPILHASDAAGSAHRRRVLQVDYAAADLPGGLKWLGV